MVKDTWRIRPGVWAVCDIRGGRMRQGYSAFLNTEAMLKFTLMNDSLLLRIVLTDPPAGVDFGLQSGSGNNYETVQKQVSGGGNLLFDFPVMVRKDKNGITDFAGPFVQGNKGDRFIYLDIGTYAGNPESEWGRRLKIPLREISESVIENVRFDDKLILEAKVPGKGKDGGPNCATVKPFAGWHPMPVQL